MKNDYFREKLEALKINKSFQKEILRLRKNIKVPVKGIAKTKEGVISWLYSLPGYLEWKKEVKELYEKSLDRYFEILNAKTIIDEKQERRLGEEGILFGVSKEFNESLTQTIRKFNLSESYLDYIRHYIIFDDFDYFIREKVGVHLRRFRKGTEAKLFLEIYPDTTINDISGKWDIIKKAQNELLGFTKGRKRGRDNFERDKMIYKLRESGLKAKEICSKIREKFGKTPSYNEIYKIADRFKSTYFGKK